MQFPAIIHHVDENPADDDAAHGAQVRRMVAAAGSTEKALADAAKKEAQLKQELRAEMRTAWGLNARSMQQPTVPRCNCTPDADAVATAAAAITRRTAKRGRPEARAVWRRRRHIARSPGATRSTSSSSVSLG